METRVLDPQGDSAPTLLGHDQGKHPSSEAELLPQPSLLLHLQRHQGAVLRMGSVLTG